MLYSNLGRSYAHLRHSSPAKDSGFSSFGHNYFPSITFLYLLMQMKTMTTKICRPFGLKQILIGTALFGAIAGLDNANAAGRNEVPLPTVNGIAQNGKKITGVVSDALGPVIGANVIVKGTTNGAITDLDGKFTLTDVPQGAILQISYIGYNKKEMPVGNQTVFAITLSENTQALDEVVVVGYGSQKKVNLTGAVSQVSSKVLESRPITTTSAGLQGTIPNLQITPSTGKPGESATINVRGTTSINGGSPLVLVDGVEMSMDLVNPNDIANVTVLKDAAASSIYGVRAAYGVVLITTKQADKGGKTTVSYSGNVAFSKPTILPDMVDDSYTHATFVNQAMKNANLSPLYNQVHIDGIQAYAQDPVNNPVFGIVNGNMYYYGHTDWTDLMLKNAAFSHRHNVNISGGNEKTRFYSSVGYVSQDGIIRYADDNYQRLNTRLTVENQTTKWLKLGFKLLYNYTTQEEPTKYKDDVFHQMVFSTPVKMADPFPGDPAHPEYDQFIGKYFDDQNPISLLKEGGRTRKQNHDVWAGISADLNIMEGWTARVDFTYNTNMQRDGEHRKKIDMVKYSLIPTEGNTANNHYKLTDQDKSYYSFNAYTQYEKTLGKHYMKGMVGFNQELTKYTEHTAQRRDLISQNIPSLGLASGEQTVTETGYEWALRGGFFRLNYIYNDRYLLEVNGRYDGTSRFPSDNRYVFLPSFSLAWRMSEEAFMQSTRTWLDNLKIRGSYGILGNQLITEESWTGNTKYYPYIPFMSAGVTDNYLLGSAEAILVDPAGLAARALTWEKAKTVNVGLDATVLDSRLDMSFDWYQRTTSDMLVKVKYPELLGTNAPPANKAELRTRGWELAINWKDRIGKDFTYGLGFILSDSQAEITKYDNPTGTLTDHYVGKNIGDIWGYETEGIFQTDDEVANHPDQSKLGSNWKAGDIRYKNLNNDDKIDNGDNTISNHGDLKVIGNTTPRYQYGITADLGWKGFYLNVFLQGVGKRDYWPSAQAFWPVATQYFNTQKWFVEDSWNETNRDAYFPRPIARETKNQQKQTRYLQDASYLRLKNISLGYHLPSQWLAPLHMSQATIFVSGENVAEISHMKGAYDPEAAGKNGSMVYPFQRTYSFGVNVTF